MKSRVQLGLAGCLLAAVPACTSALDTESNPYERIVSRNLFGLKDPPAIVAPGPEKAPTPKITLQGITTILGRKQVLFKYAQPAKPPQPATEVSKVLAVGERDGEIEVLEIDEAAGVVKFSNYGVPETKTMKDDAAKPSGGGGAIPTIAGVQAGGVPMPTLPQPAAQSIPSPAFTSAATPQPSTTRPVRGQNEGTSESQVSYDRYGGKIVTTSTAAMTPGSTAAFEAAARRTTEETALLYQINKAKNDQLREAGVKLPKLPNHPLLRDQLEPQQPTPKGP